MKKSKSSVFACLLSYAALGVWVAVLSACSTLSPKHTPPDWVLNPPQDSADSFWGVGEGFDLESAKRTALKDVAARLRVTISATLDSQLTVNNDSVNRSARNRVSEVVQKTEFSRFKVEQTALSPNGLYALVKVDRRVFIQEYRFKYDNLQLAIQALLGDVAQQRPVQRYQSQRKAAELAEEAMAIAHILRVADPGFSSVEAIRSLKQIQEDAQAAAAQLVFVLRCQAEDADIAQQLSALMSSQGMRVATRSAQGLLLTIRNHEQQTSVFGNFNTRLQIVLNLQDDLLQTIAVKEYNLSGNALDNFASARKNALRQLSQTMQEVGVVQALGLK